MSHLSIKVAVMVFVVFTFPEFLRISVTKFLVSQTIRNTLPTEKHKLLTA